MAVSIVLCLQQFYNKVVEIVGFGSITSCNNEIQTFARVKLVSESSCIDVAVFLSSETGTILMERLKQENKLRGLCL